MRAVAGPLPPDEGWAFEIKWDGMRAVASIEERVTLRSVRGNDVGVSYPELAGLGEAVGGLDAVLDGEIVALDDDGIPSFSLLQQRMHLTDPAQAAERAAIQPVVYVIFDLLYLDGREVWRLPYLERRRLLGELVEPGPHWTVPAHRVGGGAELLEAARQQSLEGVVAKRVDRPYEPGRRSPAWRKVKVRHRQEFVVGGWVPGQGRRHNRIGSLMLGCHDQGILRWVGNVGTGFTDAELRRWREQLTPQDRCPFDPVPADTPTARWVDPTRVVEVEFAEWTPEGRLRHASYLGERTDKPAEEVECSA
jgi:bifunctional non-homologous end joining protein LigD